MGQSYESLKEHLPGFEQQRADWHLDQLIKIQQWLQNFRAEAIREMLVVESHMAEFQKRQEQALLIGIQQPSENQSDATKMLALQMLLRSL